MKQLLDTNIILYFLTGRLKSPLNNEHYCVSVITQLELLSYPSLDQEAEQTIQNFLEFIEIINLEPEIVSKTIEIRKKYKFKLPDAIIIATAEVLGVDLLSNDQEFSKVSGLKLKSLDLIGKT